MKKVVYEVNQFYRVLGTVCPKYKNISVTTDDLKDDHILSEVLYDLEDNVYTYEGAMELYYEVQRLKDKHKVIKTIGVILMVVGFVFMLGTAGASDLNTIPFAQIMIQLIMSLSITALGFIIIKKLED